MTQPRFAIQFVFTEYTVMQQHHRQLTVCTNYGLYQDHHQTTHYLESKTIPDSAWSGPRAAPSSTLTNDSVSPACSGDSVMDDIFLSAFQFFTFNVTEFHHIDMRLMLHSE